MASDDRLRFARLVVDELLEKRVGLGQLALALFLTVVVVLLLGYNKLLVLKIKIVLGSLLTRGLDAVDRLVVRLERVLRSWLDGTVWVSPMGVESVAAQDVLQLVKLKRGIESLLHSNKFLLRRARVVAFEQRECGHERKKVSRKKKELFNFMLQLKATTKVTVELNVSGRHGVVCG